MPHPIFMALFMIAATVCSAAAETPVALVLAAPAGLRVQFLLPEGMSTDLEACAAGA